MTRQRDDQRNRSLICAGSEIVGFADASAVGTGGYIFAIVGEQAYLLQWHDGLEVTFRGQLTGLKYLERTSALGVARRVHRAVEGEASEVGCGRRRRIAVHVRLEVGDVA